MALKMILQRKKLYSRVLQPNNTYEDSTIGELTIKNDSGEVLYRAVTLENGGESTDESGKDKRIVAREYRLKWHNTSRNGYLRRLHPEFDKGNGRATSLQLYTPDLPSFEKRYILIHCGNFAQDTLGCILLGRKEDGNGNIIDSASKVAELYRLVRDQLNIDSLRLIVREIDDGDA